MEILQSIELLRNYIFPHTSHFFKKSKASLGAAYWHHLIFSKLGWYFNESVLITSWLAKMYHYVQFMCQDFIPRPLGLLSLLHWYSVYCHLTPISHTPHFTITHISKEHDLWQPKLYCYKMSYSYARNMWGPFKIVQPKAERKKKVGCLLEPNCNLLHSKSFHCW